MSDNNQTGRRKKTSGTSGDSSIKRRGSGLGTGPVGQRKDTSNVFGKSSNDSGLKNLFPSQGSQQSSGEIKRTINSQGIGSGGINFGSSGGKKKGGGGSSLFKIIIFILIALLVFNLIKGFFDHNGGGGGTDPVDPDNGKTGETTYYTPAGTTSDGWNIDSNVETMDTTVATGARDKFTTIRGNNQDVVTIMVYMCGADLESQGGMATSDLVEMYNATISDNVRIIVYTGGATKWKNSLISNKVNQIYRVHSGGLETLESNAGNASMTDPDTLESFIEYCVKNYNANRYELIFWDHGGGTISGYGYDEKYANSGSMSLAEIDEALTNAGVKFDFVGFDACLMATTETALMLSEHADYLIGSEESEPGYGWYYTEWLTALSNNTSMDTVSIGKKIADDFVAYCKKYTPRQSATLSLVDLAEAQATIPAALKTFSQSANDLIENQQYTVISRARSGAREFAQSSKIDQVDFVDMLNKIGTTEAKALSDALLSCIKYNTTSSDMTNSYGLSVYFPYRSTKYVNTVLKVYDKIELEDNYSELVRNFATLETSGQISSGGSQSAYTSISGNSSYDYSSQSSSGMILDVLNSFLGGSYSDQSSYSGYYDDIFSYLFGRTLNTDNISKTIALNHFDVDLTWKNGKIAITEDQWKMVDSLLLNVFYDDGEGYIDLGTDSIYTIDKDGNLVAEPVTTWVSINGQVVPYYYSWMTYSGEDYTMQGVVPVLLNGQQANLVLIQQTKGEELTWAVAGVMFTYDDTAITAKNIAELNVGDTIDFVCDFYDYNGNYQDSYAIGDQMVYNGTLEVLDANIDNSKVLAMYQLTDIYQQDHWTPVFGK